MQIKYLGHSCFLLTTRAGTRALTDPFGEIGYPMPKVCADLVTVSHNHYDHCNTAAVGGKPAVYSAIRSEMGNSDLKIEAFPCFHDDAQGALRGKNLMFSFTADGVRVVHLGDLGEPICGRILDFLRGADVLLLPVGGRYTLGAAEAAAYVEALMPPYVVPMHYKTPDLNIGIAGIEGFLRKFEGKSGFSVKKMPTLEVVPRRSGACEVVILERSI